MCSSVSCSPSICLARRTASSTRIVYAAFSPGLRWNEQYAHEAEQTLVRLRCRLTLNITRSPFFSVRTWCASRPSQTRSSDWYSATPSSRVSRSPAYTLASSSRRTPTSTTTSCESPSPRSRAYVARKGSPGIRTLFMGSQGSPASCRPVEGGDEAIWHTNGRGGWLSTLWDGQQLSVPCCVFSSHVPP